MSNPDQPPASPPISYELTRELILSGTIRQAVAAAGQMKLWSEAELTASLDHTLAAQPAPGDVWIFAYGSLIWNPTFHFAEQQVGRVHGWHRSFCLWTVTSRGTPERPGLTLGLDRGGSCGGVAFRLDPAVARHELGIVWKREMIGGAYVPRWVPVKTEAGTVAAIAFAIDRNNPRYTGPIAAEKVAEVGAYAHGWLGPCSDYIYKTADALKALGIRDHGLEWLVARIRMLQAELAAAAS
jgi:cation transport protein ChaC